MGENDVRTDARWKLVERVAASRQFQKAARLRDLLLHICRETLLGHTNALTEHQIGSSVFGRKSDYNPSDDSIVRVQARQLRLRLEEYFRDEGRHEPLVIEIPKGNYVPVFRDAGTSSYAQPGEENDHGPGTQAGALHRRLLMWVPLAAAIVLSVVCAALWWQNRQLRSVVAPSAGNREPWLLTSIFGPDSPVNVVMGDGSYGTFQDIIGDRLRLEDYLQPGYPLSNGWLSKQDPRWVSVVGARPLTNFWTMLMAQQMEHLAAINRWRYTLRYARDLKMRDLAEGNQMLVGSRMSNPWVDLFEHDLVFRSEWDDIHKVLLFRNTQAKPGDRNVYASGGPNGEPGPAFAVVALLDRTTASGASSRVLIIEGTNMEGSEAAWEFLSGPRRNAESLARTSIPSPKPGRQSHLEILIETIALAGSPGQVSVRAVYSK
jgi:hypothetical protein